MKKLLIIGGVVAGAVILAKRFAPSCSRIDFEQMIERMPENAPPKWMFTNITAIRQNTDRILQVLERDQPQPERRP